MKTLHVVFLFSFVAALGATDALAGRQAGTDMLREFSEAPPAGLFTDAQEARPDSAFKPVNWQQPPLGCVEEMVPHRVERRCLDLSRVANPVKDWPDNISAEEKAYWWGQRRGLNVCRSEEVLRRERARPGSMNPAHVELAWMSMDALRNTQAKVDAIYESSRLNGVPLHVLTGAVYQESLFSELGIADDGGNFSCGVQQINLIGWCGWMNLQSPSDKQAMGWPQQTVPCSDPNYITLSWFKPLYEIAKTRLNGLPEYRLAKEHFANIPLERVVKSWPSASPQVQKYRYQLIMSYINNCSDARRGILAKGHELAGIYARHVSPAMKAKDRYAAGQGFARACREKQADSAYPLHTGWLLTIASYNAGPRAIDAVAHYNKWSRDDINNPEKVKDFTPTDMVTSLYWAGTYNRETDNIDFKGLGGGTKSWTWFKGCVAQRHIARVMQHVTLLPEFFVDSLENGVVCARSQFDSGGRLIQTAVPEFRQKSSGTK